MKNKTVIVGITSGIAAYKMLDLITLLTQDANVLVVMTKHATEMVSKKEFEKASNNKVYTEVFEKGFNYKDILKNRYVDHIDLADKADVVVIAPATANIVGKMANGIADDFLTTFALATQAPIVVFPSMNVHMWQHPAVVENISTLQKRGIVVIEPDEGSLACGYEGKGRLPKVVEIHKEIMRLLKKTSKLLGKKIIVTAGGTKEPIDGVRFITNKSSGKMGIAIAETCFLQGAEVLLVRSKTSVSTRYDIKQILFETADQLLEILEREVKKYDVLFQTAAVSDFKVASKKKGKLDSKKDIVLKLTPRKKIIAEIKKWHPKIKLVVFKAVWGDSEKIKENNADAIVINDVSKPDRGFLADDNEVIVIKKTGEKKNISLRSKREVAEELVSFLLT
ncbi:MAG: bifunctional phosphopantothenoylcysteine decarboxylase/phosphopantothenate--cysteine ligase CoaBC [Candidatus Levybacteria bacterium]|nr:bifunctional phosphopantothenoylcysteine decarboxylase/phosphopantothenate--cysteine ligase CoaBC [Candidatus Levybacteria bacterium]